MMILNQNKLTMSSTSGGFLEGGYAKERCVVIFLQCNMKSTVKTLSKKILYIHYFQSDLFMKQNNY